MNFFKTFFKSFDGTDLITPNFLNGVYKFLRGLSLFLGALSLIAPFLLENSDSSTFYGGMVLSLWFIFILPMIIRVVYEIVMMQYENYKRLERIEQTILLSEYKQQQKEEETDIE